jgi:phage gp36-like protein
MQQYATIEDFIDRFGQEETIQLTNLDRPTAETVDRSRLEPELIEASREIDSALAVRYDVPIPAPIPSSLRQICLTIARYRCEGSQVRETVEADYNRSIEYLDKLASRKRILIRDDGQAVDIKPDRIQHAVDTPDIGDYEGNGLVFTRRSLANYPAGSPIGKQGEYEITHDDRG